jgi:hypothetical protein
MKRILAIFALVFVSLSAGAACGPGEHTVFSCPIGKKWVSVCASKDLSPTAGYLQYRFGPEASPEISFPPETERPHPYVQAKTLMFSGGGGAYLRFVNGQYGYVVYTAIGKGWGTKDGVVVEKDGKQVASLKCGKPPVSELGPEFFTSAGLPEDSEEFELP